MQLVNRFKILTDKVRKIAPRARLLEQADEIATQVIKLEPKYEKLSDAELKNKTYRIIDKIRDEGMPIDAFLIDALAMVREIIYRTHGLKAYKVQLIGAIIAHYGDFAEMMTGEGKTLVLVMVSFVNALSKKGVHIVTVNEYLVQRDAEFSNEALSKLGISVGYITSALDNDTKRKMYACDITYAPNSELGFDYLRDNMVQNIADKMQRELNFAIVDEGDSILIDEARTPLIIAGSPSDDISLYVQADRFVNTLNENDYVMDAESSAINLNDNGIRKACEFFNLKSLYDVENSEIVHRIMNALKANFTMFLGKEYIVKFNEEKQEEEIALIDSFTGRILAGRMYSAGLHQAIQAKERVRIEPENLTIATITYQSFFRLYKKLAGVSGTALTESQELLDIYNMVVVPIPTNKPVKRIDHPDFVFGNKKTKWKYIVSDIKKRHATGQPILVGTGSVEDSELLHKLLDKINIPHQVLNAKNHAREAEIVKLAGQKGAVTVATNMAGRGTDIKLGEGVKELGGLYVLGTERNESRRIDNQLRGRSGRQGDIGESRFFISLEDSLFKRFATDKFDKAQWKMGEDIIDLKFFSKLLDRTQKRVENLNYDVRKNLIDYDYVLSEQRELIYKQRDYILKSNNLLDIVIRMIPYVVEYGISIYKQPENINMIDINSLVKYINDNYLLSNYQLNANDFIDLSEEQIKDKIINHIQEELTKLYNESAQSLNQWREILIVVIDSNWTIFLDKIQKLRDGVTLRSFEQKSPLNIYVEDSDRLFVSMTKLIAQIVIRNIVKLNEVKYANAQNTQSQSSQGTVIGNIFANTTSQQAQPTAINETIIVEETNNNKTFDEIVAEVEAQEPKFEKENIVLPEYNKEKKSENLGYTNQNLKQINDAINDILSNEGVDIKKVETSNESVNELKEKERTVKFDFDLDNGKDKK